MSFTSSLMGERGTRGLYESFKLLFTIYAPLAFGGSLLMDAPFGRFVKKSRLLINGDAGWMIMELFSPICFVLSIGSSPHTSSHPVSFSFPSFLSTFSSFFIRFKQFDTPRKVLVALYLIHYSNRAIISTLRNPGRAKMHIMVPISAIIFNFLNGSLQGWYIGSSTSLLQPKNEGLFLVGMGMWVLDFIGNILSDEVLYNLKRSSKAKATSKGEKGGRYSIPRGFLYDYPFGGVSHPAYTCEWFEWTGWVIMHFALAPSSARGNWWAEPPALFLWNEIAAMLPRAIAGHKWYRETFGSEWPSRRKIVIPGLL